MNLDEIIDSMIDAGPMLAEQDCRSTMISEFAKLPPCNVCFWVWIGDGWVKLTLRPGQILNYNEGGPHEEGYSYTSTEWEYDADEGKIIERWYTDSRDCDGRHGGGGSRSCRWSSMRSIPRDDDYQDPDGWGKPDWQDETQEPVYDQYAQMMGY